MGVAADSDRVAALAQLGQGVGLAGQRHAALQRQRHVGVAGLDHGAEVAAAAGGEDGDVGDLAALERADQVGRGRRPGGVDRGHLPQIFVAEVAGQVVAVERVGAGQLAQHVGRAAVGPVGAQRDGAAHAGEGRHLGGHAVQADVGARRPDDLRVVARHLVVVGGGQADGVDVRGVLLGEVLAAVERRALAAELLGGVVVDALGDVGQERRLGGHGPLVGGVAPAAVGVEGLVGVAQREGLEVDLLEAARLLRRLRVVEVAQHPQCAAGADHRGGAAQRHAQLAPLHADGGLPGAVRVLRR